MPNSSESKPPGKRIRRAGPSRETHLPSLTVEEQSALLYMAYTRSPNGMAFVDRNFVIRSVNESCVQLAGMPVDSMIGRTVAEVFPGWARQLGHAYEQVCGSGKPFKSEALPFEFEDQPDRGVTYWESIISPVYGADGTFLGCLLEGHEVTESKRAEEALRASEEKYRTMVDFSNDLIWIVDSSGNFLWFNRRAEEVSGYRSEDWEGKSFVPLIIPDDLPKVQQVFAETLAGHAQDYEVRVYRQDGTLFSLLVNTAPIFSGGKVVGTISFGKDITDRKRAQEALRESEEKFRGMFEESPIGVELYDSNGLLLDVNRACLDIFGASSVEDVRGFKIFDDPNVPAEVKAKLRNGELVRYEAPFDFQKVRELNLYRTTKSGTRYLDVLISPIGLN